MDCISYSKTDFINLELKDAAGDFVDDFDWDGVFSDLEDAGYIGFDGDGFFWEDREDIADAVTVALQANDLGEEE